MGEQYELYDGTPPHVPGSDTSLAAARSIARGITATHRRLLALFELAKDYGYTDDEMERALEMRHQSVSARRRELVLLGKVVDSGKRRVTSSGRTAAVWIRTRLA